MPPQTNLDTRHALGQAVIQDRVYAHMWGNLGASNGDETSVKIRDSVASETTPADLSTAWKLSRECVRKKYKEC